MAAFRLGRTEEAHEILLEISSNAKHRILLAQSVSKIADKTVEFEQEERRRLIPYHMQLNLQVLESFQFICSMLIEIPRAAQNQKNLGKSNFSKPFKALIDYYDQKALTLAEEFNRDFIVGAARHLNKSEWKRAIETVLEIPAIKRLPERLDGSLEKNLAQAFQRASLSIFVDKTARQYNSFSLQTLSEMFSMEKKEVIKFLSKKILNN